MHKLAGENSRLSVLTDKDVRKIKKLLKQGCTQRWIASQFDVHYSLISLINTGKRWSHIK